MPVLLSEPSRVDAPMWLATPTGVAQLATRGAERACVVGRDGSVAGAQLTVDGRAVGSLPLVSPLVVTAGRHVLRLTAPEHEVAEVVVELAEGARYRGFVTMLAASPYGEAR